VPSLDGPFLKTDWALNQIYGLNAQVNTFRSLVNGNAHPTRIENDPQTGENLVVLNVAQSPPPEWGAWVGEIVHNTRSALDHLIWQLACSTVGDPDRSTPLDEWWGNLQFPIFYKPKRIPKNFRNAVRNRLHNVPAVAQDRIENEQPYNTFPSDPPSDLLARLAELSNIDKHQTLHVIGHYITPTTAPIVELDPSNYSITNRWDRGPGPIKANEVLTRFSGVATGPNPQVKVKSNIIPDIGLEDPSPLSGWDTDLVGALVSIWSRVETILRNFQDLLPLTGPPRVPLGRIFDKRLMLTPTEPIPEPVE